MQNIDLLLLLQPTLAVAITLGCIIYWWDRKSFGLSQFLLSFAAYFLAIAAKYAIQLPTISAAESALGSVSIGFGLYLGLQTVVLEVGLAYVFAVYGARRRGLRTTDAVPFGLSLSFWENGVLLGALSILNLSVTYLLLTTGTSEAAKTYAQLVAAQPALFMPPASLLPLELIGTLERISSMLVHTAWGVLCVLAAVTGRKRYLAYALPMGLVDALVPFASLNSNLFEAVVFLLSVGFILIAWRALKQTTTTLQPPAVSKD
jgi:hypothetical protein